MAGKQSTLEGVGLRNFYQGKRIWLSGHTGFKGAWLAEWLLQLGARVVGFSLPPSTQPSLFTQLNLAGRMVHEVGDINDRLTVLRSLEAARPDFVFHLAAQPLVRLSYRQPVETFSTNVLGTIHVLDALREMNRACTAVFITTDKVYANRESHLAYREDDPLGGHDPYSASKAAAEIAIASYRQAFSSPKNGQLPLVRIASARAGNVIGGGDWAEDRILPDAMRTLAAGRPIPVRNPGSTRPWQHVLEPLGGYLLLAGRLASSNTVPEYESLAGAFNFGPENGSNRPVKELVEEILKHWPGGAWEHLVETNPVHEAGRLHLAHEKAYQLLGWSPRWNFSTTVEKTVNWYRQSFSNQTDVIKLTQTQIHDYSANW